jgi:type II secretory pathway predicted ATPase ExeA
MIALTHVWNLSREPFGSDIPVDKLFPLPRLKPFVERFEYAISLGASTVITGEVGTGKSTSLRYAASRLHPSEYRLLSVIATTGSMVELLRQICFAFGAPPLSSSSAKLYQLVRELLQGVAEKKQIPVLIVDEAHLLRTEVFAQLHLVSQGLFDSRSLLPIVLSGQPILTDKLLYHPCRPFASRVIGRTDLLALQLEDMKGYLRHHLELAGATKELLSEEAVLAIHQGSGGLLRRAGSLARGALLAAAQESAPLVAAEHVRIASTEIF